MDCTTAIRLLPAVREHETNRELVWQVELPENDRLRLSLDGRVLTVRVLHDMAAHEEWRTHADAAAV
jgi:hypothetical protein